MRTLSSSLPATTRTGTINKGTVNATANDGDSSYIVSQLRRSQQPNNEFNSRSNSPPKSSDKHGRSVSVLNSRNKNLCMSSKQLSNGKNDRDLESNEDDEKVNSSDEEEKFDAKDNCNIGDGRDMKNKKMAPISPNICVIVKDNKHSSDDADGEDSKGFEKNNNKMNYDRVSVRKLKYSKSRKANSDTDEDDDDADDEDTDNDDVDEDEKDGVAISFTEHNTKVTKIEEKPFKNSLLQELQARMSNLKVKDDTSGLDVVKKISELQISSSEEESTDDSDSSSVDCEYLSRAPPEKKSSHRTALLKQSSAPYPSHHQKYLRTPDRVSDSFSHPQPAKDCSDLSDIVLSHYEREDLKKMTQNALHILENEFSVKFGISDDPSSNYKTPLENNLKPVSNNSPPFVCNIPPDSPPELCNAGYIPPEYPSKMLNYNYCYPNNSLEAYNQNGRPAVGLESPDSNISIDSFVTDDGSTNLKRVIDDVTSDYGSPSGSNELSPAPSVSPEYKNTDSTMYRTLINPGSYVGAYEEDSLNQLNESLDNNSYNTKINITREDNSLASSFSSMTSMAPLQTQPQEIGMKTAYQNGYMLPDTAQTWNSLPSAKYNHNIENVQPKRHVNTSTYVENIGKMVIFNTPAQNISCESVVVSGESGTRQIKEYGKESNVKIGKKTNFRRIIQVSGPQVYETGMQRPGLERLTDLCKSDKKKSSLMIQWVTALVETNRLDEQSKSLIIIKLLNQLACIFGDKPKTEETQNLKRVWAEKLMAYIQVVDKLLKNAEIFSIPDADGNTPLKIAAFDNYKEPLIARIIADRIVNDNKNPNQVNEKGESILHLLCQRGESHVKVLAELLNVKKEGRPAFNVNCTNYFGQTPLHVAVNSQFRSLAVVKVLIAHHARVDAQDFYNNTPLHIALSGDFDLGVLKMLLQSQSSQQAFNIQDSEKNFPIMIAGKNTIDKKKQLDAIQLLVISGANIKPLKQIMNNLQPSNREDIKNLLQCMKKY